MFPDPLSLLLALSGVFLIAFMRVLICVPVIPLAIWAGWRMHERLDQQKMYRICYGLLIVTALKLLWDGVSGLLYG